MKTLHGRKTFFIFTIFFSALIGCFFGSPKNVFADTAFPPPSCSTTYADLTIGHEVEMPVDICGTSYSDVVFFGAEGTSRSAVFFNPEDITIIDTGGTIEESNQWVKFSQIHGAYFYGCEDDWATCVSYAGYLPDRGSASYTSSNSSWYIQYSSYDFDSSFVPNGIYADSGMYNFVGYVNDSQYSLHLMKPDMGFLPQQTVFLNVNPDPDFSTVWFARFPRGYENETFLTVKNCDENFESCTVSMALTSLADQGATADDVVISFQLDFNVVADETEFYLIQEWKDVGDSNVETVATVPLSITGTVDTSLPYDTNYYDTTPDYGFLGNLLHSMFIPDSNFFVNNINLLESNRKEKFVFYDQIKTELTGGIDSLSSALGEAPEITIALYGAEATNVLDTSEIDSYMPTLRGWMSAFLWVLFSIFIIKSASSIIRT